MDVILINPPSTSRINRIFGPNISYFDVLRATYLDEAILNSFPGENLGLQYVAGDLRSRGYNVEIVDACLEEINSDEIVRRVFDASPLVIGFTGPEAIYGENVEIINKLESGGFQGHITMGGDFVTREAMAVLSKLKRLNSVCLGEGEGTMADLVTCLKNGYSMDCLENVAYRSRGKIIIGAPKKWKILDELPWPVRDQASEVLKKGLALSMSTSRGCPYMKCQFCTALKGWRVRGVVSVLDELENLKRQFGIDWITFVDEDFIGEGDPGKQRVKSIAGGIIKRKLNIEYMIDCRVDAVDKELFKLLRESGLKTVFVGFESGVQKILDIYNKGITIDQSIKAMEILQDLGLTTIPGFIFFDPFSSVEEMLRSFEFFRDIRYYDLIRLAHRLHIGRGMPVYNLLLTQNKVKRDTLDDRYDFSDPKIRDIHHVLWRYIREVFPGYLAFSKDRNSLNTNDVEELKNIHMDFFHSLLEQASMGIQHMEALCNLYLKKAAAILLKIPANQNGISTTKEIV